MATITIAPRTVWDDASGTARVYDAGGYCGRIWPERNRWRATDVHGRLFDTPEEAAEGCAVRAIVRRNVLAASEVGS